MRIEFTKISMHNSKLIPTCVSSYACLGIKNCKCTCHTWHTVRSDSLFGVSFIDGVPSRKRHKGSKLTTLVASQLLMHSKLFSAIPTQKKEDNFWLNKYNLCTYIFLICSYNSWCQYDKVCQLTIWQLSIILIDLPHLNRYVEFFLNFCGLQYI